MYLIQNLPNPYALLSRCDYYVSASFYEGLGTNLADADVLGLSCVATDVPGNHAFMERACGMLVENSEQGIENALIACLEEKVPKRLSLEYESYNREAVAQFEALL